MMSTHKHNKHKNKTDEEICTRLQIKMWTCGYMINVKLTSLAAIMRIIASSTIIENNLAIIISQALKQLYVDGIMTCPGGFVKLVKLGRVCEKCHTKLAINLFCCRHRENLRVNPVDKHHTSLKD